MTSIKDLPVYQNRKVLFVKLTIDIVFPIAILFLISLFTDKLNWSLDFFELLGLISVYVALRFYYKSYSAYAGSSLANKIQRTWKAWFYAVVLYVLAKGYYDGIPELDGVWLFWVMFIPFGLVVIQASMVKLFCIRYGKPFKVLLTQKYDFTDFALSRIASFNIEIAYLDYSSDIELQFRAFNPDLVVIRDLKTLPKGYSDLFIKSLFKGCSVVSMDTFVEKYLGKCFVELDSTSLDFIGDVVAYSSQQYVQKRVVDIVFSILLLVASFPFIIYSAYRIKKESPGKILFSQQRVGLNCKNFTLYKFRSMHENAHFDPYTQQQDSRIFGWGNVMRKTRIDELPQLWNVLKGDMHLIGPRSEWDILVKDYENKLPYYHSRHVVRPGVTGWAQVMYPYGSNLEDTRQKLMYDFYYIKNWSIWIEIETIIRTVWVVLGRKGL
jgi:lipopolysaccharide/colanic/teichoic acid biosynthesis glycosyltransferase